MQWKKKEKSAPPHKVGDTRTRKRFFWWPTLIGGTYYWLESQLVTEVAYHEEFKGGPNGPMNAPDRIDWRPVEVVPVIHY